MKSITLVLTITISAVSGFAQSAPTGVPPFGSFATGGPDTINLSDLNVNLKIPIVSRAGRGVNFNHSIVYDSSLWTHGTAWVSVTDPNGNSTWGWKKTTPLGSVGHWESSQVCRWWDDEDRIWIYEEATRYYGFAFRDAAGTVHNFNISYYDTPTTCGYGPVGFYGTYATDGSGIYLSGPSQVTVPNGTVFTGPNWTDTNGNFLSQTIVSSSETDWTDTLGRVALKVITGANNIQYQYLDPSSTDASPHYSTVTLNLGSFSIKTNFGCAGIVEYTGSASLPTSISYPDGTSYSFTYEPTPGFSGYVTGRLASVGLPTGGTISYTYTGANNGIICSDGSTAGLTKTTPDGQWTYTRNWNGSYWATTITDPLANQTVVSFQNGFETQRQVYQGSTSGTLLRTTVTCYNGNMANCATTAVSLPITRRTVFVQLPGGQQAKVDAFYNTNGLTTEVDEYDYANPGPGPLLRKTLTSYAALGNNIIDRPATINVQDGAGNTKAQTTFTYDQGCCTATSGTPQHNSVTGSRGNPTTITYLVQGATTLSRTFAYYDTGLVQTATDINGANTTYTYGACGNSFPTSVSLPLSLSRSIGWTCSGAVQTSLTDENNQTTSYTYADAYFWRVTRVTDPLNNSTNITYNGATSMESSLTFNGGSSAVDVLTTFDALGRTHVAQQRQAPGSAYFDSVETDYDALGRPYRVTLPYSGTAGQTNPTAPATTTSYDALGRPTQVTDGGGGTLTSSYNQNDVLQTVGPAPAGENTKRRQFEYDALGRLTSVCELTGASGSGTCGQTASATGYWTRYTYDVLGNLTGVTQNAQSATQTRSYAYDGLSRLTSETNPESGTVSYSYDTVPAPCAAAGASSPGDLTKRLDAAGNSICFDSHDAFHRPTNVGSPTGCWRFAYDAATVNGAAMANAKGRLAEASTDNCTGWPNPAKITDLGFSYSARGEVMDVYQSTPHSGGYYHVNAAYWANGATSQLSGLPGLPAISYGVDGEGRPSSATAGSGQNPVSSTAYNVASQATQLNLGSQDSDTFSFDSNTGRMTQYKFNVNGQSVIGNLTWNANGTLASLLITDPFNSGNTQNCSYAHDDLARVTSANCGAAWSQTFSFDPFGNINKSGSMSFQPTYSSATNRMTSLPGFTPSYDANGNVLNDSFHQYSWDAVGRPVTIDSVGLTYDALGRMVEKNVSGTYTEIVYAPTGGKLALMSGQTLQKGFVPLPAGATAVYNSGGLSYYRHPDWLSSSRFASTPSRTMYSDTAYAPFGETYAQAGTTDLSFTGQNQDTVGGLYDFMFREYSTQGRWPSPDPAGLAAVDFANPQSLNRYAYVLNNPLALIDPLGLQNGDVTAPPQLRCFLGGFSYLGFFCDFFSRRFLVFLGNEPAMAWDTPKKEDETPPPPPPNPPPPAPQTQGSQQSCVQPNLVQRVGIKAQGFLASLFGRNIGIGIGGSAGAGIGAGVAYSFSRQMIVNPSGQAALVTTFSSAGGPGLIGPVAGMGAVGGVQFSLGTPTSSPSQLAQTALGISGAGGVGGVGVGLDAGFTPGGRQYTLTVGTGAGGVGAAGSIQYAQAAAVCR